MKSPTKIDKKLSGLIKYMNKRFDEQVEKLSFLPMPKLFSKWLAINLLLKELTDRLVTHMTHAGVLIIVTSDANW